MRARLLETSPEAVALGGPVTGQERLPLGVSRPRRQRHTPHCGAPCLPALQGSARSSSPQDRACHPCHLGHRGCRAPQAGSGFVLSRWPREDSWGNHTGTRAATSGSLSPGPGKVSLFQEPSPTTGGNGLLVINWKLIGSISLSGSDYLSPKMVPVKLLLRVFSTFPSLGDPPGTPVARMRYGSNDEPASGARERRRHRTVTWGAKCLD